MAVKVVRQANSIAVLGVPTSAAAMSAGHEAAPSALRSAGLIERLKSIGYQVTDLGDDPPRLFKPDEESPRARNLPNIIAALETLKPRMEQAVKSAALPLILSGDCSVALAVVAGARRYYRNIGLIYMDRDADLNTPATTPSGCVDGMVVSHLTGRGAAELVRFWGEPPLVREPDLALFGVDRLDPSEEEALLRSPVRRYMAAEVKRKGTRATAREAIERIHGNAHEFVLHFDVDVISDFAATNYPGSGGLMLDEVREALEVFAQEKNLAAIEVTAYNPAKDVDGNGAKIIIDLLAGVLEKRLEALKSAASVAAASTPTAGTSTSSADATGTSSANGGAAGATSGTEGPASASEAKSETAAPAVASGEGWSSDSPSSHPLEEEFSAANDSSSGGGENFSGDESSTTKQDLPDDESGEAEPSRKPGESSRSEESAQSDEPDQSGESQN